MCSVHPISLPQVSVQYWQYKAASNPKFSPVVMNMARSTHWVLIICAFACLAYHACGKHFKNTFLIKWIYYHNNKSMNYHHCIHISNAHPLQVPCLTPPWLPKGEMQDAGAMPSSGSSASKYTITSGQKELPCHRLVELGCDIYRINTGCCY